MYIPSRYLLNDNPELIAFMQRFSFATLVTAANGLPVATHLPFVITVREDAIVLTSHFARANEQWKDITQHKVLVIFSEPHAYISPSHYDKALNVPTWNYLSVHAYGVGKLITQKEEVMQVLEKTIDNYEMAYRQQWNSFREEYKLKMMNGIVAFEITVDELQGKKKLSQNKNENERARIIDSLSKSEDSSQRAIADYMRRDMKQDEAESII